MLDKKKALALAIGSSVIIGVLAALIAADEEKRESVAAYINRKKVKFFVREKLNGNEKAMAIVDRLSDEDIQRLMNLLENSKDWKESFLAHLDQVKDNVDQVKDKAMRLARKSVTKDGDWLDRALELAEKYLA
ncbi:hypothetical protein D3H64_08205 [Atopobacter sp. AH10]|uniref:hypothetical protein n=1 Tax=Atopobacter sp. AH10 TaxID=2315861 RepID=UPI000EF1BD0C|nr:hypothetical protein [Atopobacter sp. AH10]RLK62765.1 hypothetical protein D3H64_08205 [Atopobacter sp. AH10]